MPDRTFYLKTAQRFSCTSECEWIVAYAGSSRRMEERNDEWPAVVEVITEAIKGMAVCRGREEVWG